jgi:hypothetical protein
MSVVKAVLPYLPWLLPWAFVHFWVIDRVRAYFLLTEDEAMQGFADAVLPTNYSKKVLDGFRESAVHALYTDRTYASLRECSALFKLFCIMYLCRHVEYPISRRVGSRLRHPHLGAAPAAYSKPLYLAAQALRMDIHGLAANICR